jgi:hybrid cluster-associated redox disulfide protein
MPRAQRTSAFPQQGVKQPRVKVIPPRKRRARPSPREKPEQFITKDWTVSAIVERYPQATEVMAEYGLHCFGCSANTLESLEEGCLGHGFTEDDVRDLVLDINEMIRTTPARPQKLTVTKAAALAIKDVAEQEKIDLLGLSVVAGSDGGFALEFRAAPELGEKIFRNVEVSDVRVFASTLVLQRIGGATIDVREGKFKLDVEGGGKGCGGNEEGCGCKEVRM